MIIDLRALKWDIKTYKRLLEDPHYIDCLIALNKVISELCIENEIIYYKYQMVLKRLEDFSYFEATFIERSKDKDYLNVIKRAIRFYDTYKPNKICKKKIIKLKR